MNSRQSCGEDYLDFITEKEEETGGTSGFRVFNKSVRFISDTCSPLSGLRCWSPTFKESVLSALKHLRHLWSSTHLRWSPQLVVMTFDSDDLIVEGW